jgi:hypothetical protein
VQPDPKAPFWVTADVAEYLGVARTTVEGYNWAANRRRAHLAATQAAGKPHEHCRKCPRPGDLPPADPLWSARARRPAWRPATIINWKRPGSGAGGGRPPTRQRDKPARRIAVT